MRSDDRFVEVVETYVRTVIAGTPAAAPALRLLDAGGKRLRARLVWWSANATNGPRDPDDTSLVHAAAAIELAHLGSLIHDDIVDGAETRRGVATLHCTSGVETATHAGASIAHLANRLAATLGLRARRAVRRALLATCRGQVRELAVPFVRIAPGERLAIMQEKTGAFFELAASLGAIGAGADVRSCAAIRKFARRFGVAFQLADDVLDLTGDPAELGRANGADLRDGVLTLPVLLANDPEHVIADLLAQIRITGDPHAIAACTALIVRGGGTAAAGASAAWWLEHALEALDALPPSAARSALVTLARGSIARGLKVVPGTIAWTPTKVADHVISTTFVDRLAVRNTDDLPPALVETLEWFHPGFSSMITARSSEPRISRTRTQFLRCLRRDDRLSPEASDAAMAIATAHALADARLLRNDPVRTLALVDALHCAAIGRLALAPTPEEHERVAVRAQTLFEHGDRVTSDSASPRRRSAQLPTLRLSA